MLIAHAGQFLITVTQFLRQLESSVHDELGIWLRSIILGRVMGLSTSSHGSQGGSRKEQEEREVLILALWYAQFLILPPELHLRTFLHFSTAAHWGPAFSSRAIRRKLLQTTVYLC